MRLVRRTAPRVAVLEDLGGIPTNLLAARTCRRLGIPYLVWGLGRIPHNPGSRLRRYLGPVIRWYYRNADGFIGYSSHAAEVYGESDKRCTVALNAARARPRDAELEATRTAIEQRGGNGSLRVVTIGRLLEQKRIDVLLRGLRATDNPRLRLQIIGEGPDETRLRKLTHELGLDDRVQFHGGIYDDETKARLLRSCDLGVMPGRGGLAIQELMWHGLPVVSGPADGTERDLIQPARGFLIPRMPEEGDLAEVLERFEALPLERRRAMAFDALDQVSSRANIESMSRSYLSALLPYIKGGSGSPTGA